MHTRTPNSSVSSAPTGKFEVFPLANRSARPSSPPPPRRDRLRGDGDVAEGNHLLRRHAGRGHVGFESGGVHADVPRIQGGGRIVLVGVGAVRLHLADERKYSSIFSSGPEGGVEVRPGGLLGLTSRPSPRLLRAGRGPRAVAVPRARLAWTVIPRVGRAARARCGRSARETRGRRRTPR